MWQGIKVIKQSNGTPPETVIGKCARSTNDHMSDNNSKGVEESQSENLDERIEDDKAKLKILMVALKVNPDSIAEKVIRLGPKTSRFPHRLLLVSLSSLNVKGSIMREQANYRMRNPTMKIYISPDLSPKQRVENHKLY